jgi:putative transposase
MIFFGEESLRKAIQNFAAHYQRAQSSRTEKPTHQAGSGHLESAGEIQRRQRLGGMLNCYYRAAA